MKPSEAVELTDEWPTPYHYFVWESFSLLRDWLQLAEHIPDGAKHSSPAAVSLSHENDNIPKSSALAIGKAWRYLVRSPQVEDRLKKYVLEGLMHCASELHDSDRLVQLRTVLLLSIAKGGVILGGNQAHAQKTGELFDQIDHILRIKLETEFLVLL